MGFLEYNPKFQYPEGPTYFKTQYLEHLIGTPIWFQYPEGPTYFKTWHGSLKKSMALFQYPEGPTYFKTSVL